MKISVNVGQLIKCWDFDIIWCRGHICILKLESNTFQENFRMYFELNDKYNNLCTYLKEVIVFRYEKLDWLRLLYEYLLSS